MVEIIVKIFEDLEEELATGEQSTEDLRYLGEQAKKRLNRIADAVKILEDNGWSWSTGYKDLFLRKDVTPRRAREELKNLKIDPDIISIREE